MQDHDKGPEGFESDDAHKLHALQHSTAHVMAEAIQRLFPEASFAIGPPIKDGFYYDVAVPRPISEADLEAIEAEMKAIVKRNSAFKQEHWEKDRARAWFGERGQQFKLELIDGIEDDTVSIFDQDGFIDLCRGPHVFRTKNCKHFKLLKVSGAYWRGDSSREQLQRVYGTVWPTKEQLDEHLFRLEEARKRDHRRLGKQLGLFMFHDYAPGAPFFLNKGEVLYHELSEAMRAMLLDDGYQAVRTPQLFDSELWKTSGHWEHYADNMFAFQRHGGDDGGEEAGKAFGLKPMNCPCHMLIFGSQHRSYRELPLRIHDQGVLHRDELKGALGGLTRVRQFCQDDAHLFVMESQIESEVTRLLGMVGKVYEAFGMGYKVKLSTRPEHKLGDDALWDEAEHALQGALVANGMAFSINAGDGAFYGPKIDFDVVDALGREWQCATIQLDYQLPRRFSLSYVGADNAEHVPVVIHRAIYGSLERFIGILVEHYAGDFPMWLAPEQVRVLTVSDKSADYGAQVRDTLKAAGVRVHLDDRDDKIGFKIREGHGAKPVYMLIVGEKEAETGTVSVRARGVDKPEHGVAVADFVQRCLAEAVRPF